MELFFTTLLWILLFVLFPILLGLYLLSRMVGGFGNLKALYRLFTGGGTAQSQRTKRPSGTSRSSSSGGGTSRSSARGGNSSGASAQASGKMFDDSEGTYVDFEEVKTSH